VYTLGQKVMNQEQLFSLGTKLIGLSFLALAVRSVFSVFSGETPLYLSGEDFGTFFRIYRWGSVFIPATFALVGTYLIKYGMYVQDFAFRGEPDVRLDEPRHYFHVGLMLYGVYLLSRAAVGCLDLMGDLLVLLQSPAYVATDVVRERIPYEVVRTTARLGLGAFLLLKKEVIMRLAFSRH
jgi:hypothetical protein